MPKLNEFFRKLNEFLVTDVKNKKRNRLLNETISAICIMRSSFQVKGINCINFGVFLDHLKLHNMRNLYNASDDS